MNEGCSSSGTLLSDSPFTCKEVEMNRSEAGKLGYIKSKVKRTETLLQKRIERIQAWKDEDKRCPTCNKQIEYETSY